MRHYCAKQRLSDGRWDFCCGRYPVGYCTPYKEWTKEELDRWGFHEDCPSVQKAKQFKDKHHDCGHETEKEAQECYKQYVLDHVLYFGESSNSQRKCQVCGEWTPRYAMLETQMFDLCEKHCNRESVDQLYKAPSDMWIS